MRTPLFLRAAQPLVLATVAWGLVACESPGVGSAAPAVPGSCWNDTAQQPCAAGERSAAAMASMPTWAGPLAREFDDSIAPDSLNVAGPWDQADMWLGPRSQAADFVLRVKVTTTTTQNPGPWAPYRLTLRVIGQPFGGPTPPGDTIEVVVRPDNPSFAAVRRQDVRLTGKTFLGFFKVFSGAGSAEAQMHFHLSGEQAPVVAEAQRARLLSEVGYLLPVPRT
jgi:hypothetical protein